MKIGKFLSGLNKTLLPIIGRKMDMSEFHREVRRLSADYLLDFPEYSNTTWGIDHRHDNIILKEKVFKLNMEMNEDKRFKSHDKQGYILSVAYVPAVDVGITQGILYQLELEDYMRECLIKELEKEFASYTINIAVHRDNMIRQEEARKKVLDSLYKLRPEGYQPIAEILADLNGSSFTRNEREVEIPIRNIRHFVSEVAHELKCHRFIYDVDGDLISAIQVMVGKAAIVANVYTAPEHRLQGYGRIMYNAAKAVFPNLQHSTDLTKDGKEFVKHVN